MLSLVNGATLRGSRENKGNGNVHVINLAKTFVDLKRNSKFSFYFANRY